MLRAGLACLFLLALISCGGGSSTPPPPPPTLTVSPSSATVGLGGTQQFSANNAGTPATATWSVNGVQGGNSTVGTIDSTGKYTAPTSFPSPNTFMVTATASSASGNANLTVAFPNDNHLAETPPVKMGSSGGNATDFTDNGTTRTCCSGTLGALVTRGGTTFILSNNHVLNRSDAGSPGQNIQQPGLVDNQCDVTGAPIPTTVGNESEAPVLKPSPCSGVCTGPAPSNVDAAIAAINAVNVDTSGTILDLGAAGSTSIAPAPPSSTLAVAAVGQSVAKSGRSTGLTCSMVGSVTTTVSVDYDASCGGAKAFTSTFTNQVVINGGSFSAGGDSGSLVVTSDTARPVGLLFAGNSTSTTANTIQAVLGAMPGGAVTIVGGGDHAVSCDPTVTASSASTTVGASGAKLSVQQSDRVTAVKEKYASRLLADPGISDVGVGASADNPQEGALVVTVRSATTVPAVLDGVRTRVIYANIPVPRVQVDANRGATLLNQNHAASLIQERGIQGVGIGISDDNPAEAAMVIYVISGVPHATIPPVMDGLRTKIIEGDRFRAFGWGHPTKSTCTKSQSAFKQSAPSSDGKLPQLP